MISAALLILTPVCVQVRELAAYLRLRNAEQNRLELQTATVTSVKKVGMGDRYTVSVVQWPLWRRSVHCAMIMV